MYIKKPSVTKIETVNRVNLLHGTPGQMIVSLPRYGRFMTVTKKTPDFRHRN